MDGLNLNIKPDTLCAVGECLLLYFVCWKCMIGFKGKFSQQMRKIIPHGSCRVLYIVDESN